MGRGGKTEEKKETQGKVQHNRKGSDSRNREAGKAGRRTRRRKVCGGPTPNPASARGFKKKRSDISKDTFTACLSPK